MRLARKVMASDAPAEVKAHMEKTLVHYRTYMDPDSVSDLPEVGVCSLPTEAQ